MENLEFKTKWLKIIYFATSYGFVVSMLYLFGYWSTFDINILEYIKISDVIKICIYPIITSVSVIIIGLIVGGFFARWGNKLTDNLDKLIDNLDKVSDNLRMLDKLNKLGDRLDKLDKLNGQKGEKFKKLDKLIPFIAEYCIIVMIILFPFCFLYMRMWTSFWISFALVCPSVTNYIIFKYKEELLIKLIPFPGYEGLILWIFIGILSLAFGYGKAQSLSILETGNCFYINVSVFKDKELFQDQKRLKYLGLGGDFVFFLSEDNTKIYILEPSKIPVLELYKSKSQTRTEATKEIKNKT